MLFFPPSFFQREIVSNLPPDSVVCEIGFNAGHSSVNYLIANPNIRLVSFDLGEHQYVRVAQEFIDYYFPGKLELILGTSLETVPNFIKTHPGFKCDLIHVDGGHLGDVPIRGLFFFLLFRFRSIIFYSLSFSSFSLLLSLLLFSPFYYSLYYFLLFLYPMKIYFF